MTTAMRLIKYFARLTGVLFATAAIAASPELKIQTGPDAEVTFDGLYRVDSSVMALAWAKPDLDLSRYTKVMLLPPGMSFKTTDSARLQRSATDFALSEDQKLELREILLEAYTEELARSERFELVDEPGPGVLLIRGALLDVVSHVPPEPVGRGATFLRSLGEATLVVELWDASSNEILARAIDRRAVSSSQPIKSTSVSNTAEVRRTAKQWAKRLRERLDQLSAA